MQKIQEAIIPKNQLLSDFDSLKKWLSDYWQFLEELPLEIFTEEDQVIEYLKEQHKKLKKTGVKFQFLEILGATLKFTLKYINLENLTFQIPANYSEHPPEFSKVAKMSEQLKSIEKSLQNLVDQVLYLSKHLPPDSEERLTPLLQAISSFFKSIIRQDGDDMRVQLSQINLLSSTRESFLLVQEIGKITRDIYNSLQDLSTNLDTEEIKHATDEMPDAVQKLYSVIKRLEDAANDNLDFLEKLLQKSEENIQAGEEINSNIMAFREKFVAFKKKYSKLDNEMEPMLDLLDQQIKPKMDRLLDDFRENENLFITIMANQGFQDLTGQTLKKIIDFIEQLELRLLELIKKYSPQSTTTSETPKSTATTESPEKKESAIENFTKYDIGKDGEEIALHGPDETENKKSTQGDVDSLLAELGF